MAFKKKFHLKKSEPFFCVKFLQISENWRLKYVFFLIKQCFEGNYFNKKFAHMYVLAFQNGRNFGNSSKIAEIQICILNIRNTSVTCLTEVLVRHRMAHAQ